MKPFAFLTPLLAMLAATAERQGHRVVPPPTEVRVNSLQAPAGFRIERLASGLGKPRMLAIAGDCVRLVDEDRDGRADRCTVVAREPGLLGIALHGDDAYLATVHDVFRARRRQDGSFGPLQKISGGLPEGGRHPNRTLGFGPDGLLYLSVGSTCNVCRESNEESATILRLSPDGSRREIFASGLRNTRGFDQDPSHAATVGAGPGR
jgi:glucose/arabinose dehydrogenase